MRRIGRRLRSMAVWRYLARCLGSRKWQVTDLPYWTGPGGPLTLGIGWRSFLLEPRRSRPGLGVASLYANADGAGAATDCSCEGRVFVYRGWAQDTGWHFVVVGKYSW